MEAIKRNYRKSILREVVAQASGNVSDGLRKIDMIKVIDTVSAAWDKVAAITIRRSWKKIIPLPDCASQSENDAPTVSNEDFIGQLQRLDLNLSSSDVQDWMNCDGPGYELMDEQGIVSLVCNEEEDKEEENEEEDLLENNRCPFSHAEALGRIDYLLTYYRFQPDATASTISWLLQARCEERGGTTRKCDKKQI